MKNKEVGFFRMLFGFNTQSTKQSNEDMEQENEIQRELEESIKRINKMASKYSIEKFEVAPKSPKIKKDRVEKEQRKPQIQEKKPKSIETKDDKGMEIE